MSIPEYDSWLADPTPEHMAGVVNALGPTITSEVQRFNGPKPLLRSKAKILAIKAIKKYDPTRGAHLRSWVTTQLQPLSRYSMQLRPIQAPEVAVRQAAEVNTVRERLRDELDREPELFELADETGLSQKRIKHIQRKVVPAISESVFVDKETGVPDLPATNNPKNLGEAQQAVYDSLNPRDKAIFDMRIGAHGKQALGGAVIAKRLGVTPAFVSQRAAAISGMITDYQRRTGA